MRRDLSAYQNLQVFLNYPLDAEFLGLSNAMSFAVVAGGLLPVSAHDLSSPDRPRLQMLVEAIQECHYSAHDLSRAGGEGPMNHARMNMPIEMGMAMFHALNTQRRDHRCVFFVSEPHGYQAFASDLAGLDPKVHHNREERMLAEMYDWLRGVVPPAVFNSQPTPSVQDKYAAFSERLARLRGSGEGGLPTHDETREVMYQVCGECRWWDWRETRAGNDEFPAVPLAYRD
jgi:hypothetical protein